MTDLMIWEILRMVPLLGASSVLLERKKCLPARLCWFTEVGCVAVDAKDHAAFGVREDGIRMGGDIVQEVMGLLHGVFGGCGLDGGE